MNRKKILDCTLRDGGYQNNWRFGREAIRQIFRGLTLARIDYIEIGFLDDGCREDPDRAVYPSTTATTELFSRKETLPKLIGMIDFGRCDPDRIEERERSALSGIRVMFKKYLRKEALSFCEMIKARGYSVFVQPVSITNYDHQELKDLLARCNDLAPEAVYIVDTYGLLRPQEAERYLDVFDQSLMPSIAIGFHGHNNLQMGVANSLQAWDQISEREIIADGALYGMGKTAGNAPTELLAMHRNEESEGRYEIDSLIEVIERDLLSLRADCSWGYDLYHFIAAYRRCHPKYVKTLAEQTIKANEISKLVATIKEDKKLQFDPKIASALAGQGGE